MEHITALDTLPALFMPTFLYIVQDIGKITFLGLLVRILKRLHHLVDVRILSGVICGSRLSILYACERIELRVSTCILTIFDHPEKPKNTCSLLKLIKYLSYNKHQHG